MIQVPTQELKSWKHYGCTQSLLKGKFVNEYFTYSHLTAFLQQKNVMLM